MSARFGDHHETKLSLSARKDQHWQQGNQHQKVQQSTRPQNL